MDIVSLLTWLAGAGLSAVSSFVLDRIDGFASRSPNGKQTIAMVVAVLIAVAAMAARDWLSVNPAALAEMTPYAQIAIAAVSILVQQFTHAARRSGVTNG